MPTLALVVVLLLVAAVVLCAVQACGWTLGRVALGFLAYLLAGLP